MMSKITTYLIQDKKMTPVVATVLAKSLEKYDDIKNEFIYWIENNSFECDNPLSINGYTAKRIHEIAPHLDGVGVYNFIVTLRDKPEQAREYIDKGFPIK